MAPPKFLIDTNVVIGLEDNHVVKEGFARFLAKCQEHGARIFVHDASRADVLRDKDEARKRITLSKLRKFQRLERIRLPGKEELERRFGPMRRTNDAIDVELLFALQRNAVDFLVTEDQGLIQRAYRCDLGRRVFNVDEAEIWLRNAFDATAIALPNIVEQKVYQLDFADPLFASIRADYPGFDKWLEKCSREHRPCWTISVNNQLAALLIFKQETHAEAGTAKRAAKIFKICTLKVSDSQRGEKFGEQLLKQCLWHAQKNEFDLVYVTAFPKQEALILMLTRFGFEKTSDLPNGEGLYEKEMKLGALVGLDGVPPLDLHRKFYPRFVDNADVRKFCVPIWPRWHERLFPELKDVDAAMLASSATPREESERPGNTIRKVYLCRAKTGAVRPGDVLLFYMTKDDEKPLSQSITTVGIVERIRETEKYAELVRLTGKRSVFTESELREMIEARDTPVKVIDFLLAGHFQEAISLERAMDLEVLQSWPQTIGSVAEDGYLGLKRVMWLGWEREPARRAVR